MITKTASQRHRMTVDVAEAALTSIIHTQTHETHKVKINRKIKYVKNYINLQTSRTIINPKFCKISILNGALEKQKNSLGSAHCPSVQMSDCHFLMSQQHRKLQTLTMVKCTAAFPCKCCSAFYHSYCLQFSVLLRHEEMAVRQLDRQKYRI